MASSTSKELKASSGSEGFFQEVPKLQNQFNEDVTLKRIFERKLSLPFIIQTGFPTSYSNSA
jgi:hypothetical protein